jgi:hypothetical protein
MKKIRILFLLLSVFQGFSQNLPDHPRILLLQNEESGIKENLNKDKN